MKKSSKSFVCLFLCLLLLLTAVLTGCFDREAAPSASESESMTEEAVTPDPGLVFTREMDATYTVSSYTGDSSRVVIPATYEDLPVVSIGRSAFENNKALTSIVIPNSVRSIGFYAFYGCSSLTEIDIPSSVSSIENGAFGACTGLTKLELSANVTNIDLGDAFVGCSSLTSITVEEGNPIFHSEGNCLLRTARKTLVLGCKNSIIPSDGSVTYISSYAFKNCIGLTSIEIPASVKEIGWGAFYGCSSLTSASFENPHGWVKHVMVEGSVCAHSVAVDIASTDLADPSKAAALLIAELEASESGWSVLEEDQK